MLDRLIGMLCDRDYCFNRINAIVERIEQERGRVESGMWLEDHGSGF